MLELNCIYHVHILLSHSLFYSMVTEAAAEKGVQALGADWSSVSAAQSYPPQYLKEQQHQNGYHCILGWGGICQRSSLGRGLSSPSPKESLRPCNGASEACPGYFFVTDLRSFVASFATWQENRI